MNREEAIKNLVAYAYYVDEPIPEEVAQSFDMAIEALKREDKMLKEIERVVLYGERSEE